MTNTDKNSISMLRKKRNKRPFTLLEIMIAITLLTLAAGGTLWKIHSVLKKKRFQTDVALFQSQILAAHQMAFAAQADWEGILQKKGNRWIFKAYCTDPPHSRSLPKSTLQFEKVQLGGEAQSDLHLIFFSTSEIRPQGLITLENDGEKSSFDLNQILGKDGGDGIHKLGPMRPDNT